MYQRRVIAVLGVLGIGLTLSLTACDNRQRAADAPWPPPDPCPGPPGTRIELGPSVRGRPPAEFETDGQRLHLVGRFLTGGPLDFGDPETQVTVGRAHTPPIYDVDTKVIEPSTAQFIVQRNAYTPLDLPPGRYWLWTRGNAEIDIVSCIPGGVTGTPAPLWTYSHCPSAERARDDECYDKRWARFTPKGAAPDRPSSSPS